MGRFIQMLKGAPNSVDAYDEDSTSSFGRALQKTIDGETVYGPAPTKFVDLQTDFAGVVSLTGTFTVTPNGRKFAVSAILTGVCSVTLYEFDLQTGSYIARGRILVTLPNQPATTAAPRQVEVIDNGVTGWTIYISTVASVTPINGGVFRVHKVDRAHFSFAVTPFQFFMQVDSDLPGVYMEQDPTALGAAHVMNNIIGMGYNAASNELIAARGTAALLQHDGFSTNTVPNIVRQICTAPTVAAGVTFTLTGHGYVANTPLVIALDAPTGFVLSTGLNVQTVYFVRAVNLTANTFELSATAGGAAITTGSVATPTFARAYGTTTNSYLAARKTAVVTTGFAGSAILVNGCQIATPTDGGNAGVRCFMLWTGSNFYCWPLTGITAGATTLPGNFGVNALGTTFDVIAPAVVTARYSQTIGRIIFTSAAFALYGKGWVNNSLPHVFGTQIPFILENRLDFKVSAFLRGFIVTGIDVQNGWMFIAIAQAGQRGFLVADLRSDTAFGYSYVISPVRDLSSDAKIIFLNTLEKQYETTDTLTVCYKTAATKTDPIFDDHLTGWTAVDLSDYLGTALQRFVQTKAEFDIMTVLSGNPAQLQDLTLGYESLQDSSDKWKGFAAGTTDLSPSAAVYRQVKLYGGPVPQLFHRGTNDDGAVVEIIDSVTHLAQFSHSLNEGVTFLPGVGPDTIGKRLKVTRLTPPK